jgi:acetyltransferase-like isoleucine patch superfamily enzyme
MCFREPFCQRTLHYEKVIMQTEKEKMLAGNLYKACDPLLRKEREMAKEILFDFNNLSPVEIEKRNKLIKKLVGKTSERFHIEPPFRCDYGYNIEIGENFYANYNLIILDCAKVIIGDNVLIAPNVSIYAAGYPLHFELRIEEYEFAMSVTIGNNVWIGGNVVINPGVKIGDNSVIGSGSIVTKDIPANVLAFGNPCKLVRQITSDDKKLWQYDSNNESFAI